MVSRQAKWLNRKFRELRNLYGGKCCYCGSTSRLEFAHIKPTKINGTGRGKYQRYKDIVQHPDYYVLACHTCNIHSARI